MCRRGLNFDCLNQGTKHSLIIRIIEFLSMLIAWEPGASPRIFEWGGGRIVGSVTQNSVKIGKDTRFGPLHSRIWWVRPPPDFKSGGYEYSPPPP